MIVVSSMLKNIKSGLRPTRLDDCNTKYMLEYQPTGWNSFNILLTESLLNVPMKLEEIHGHTDLQL